MDFMEGLRIVVAGMLGTIGFSIFFKSNKSRIFCCAVGGALTCLIYVFSFTYFDREFFQYFFPALFATVYAEMMARVMKAPATPILACSIISLVPGGKLYYTTYYFVINDMENFYTSLSQTLKIAAGLAIGIIFVSVIVNEINRHKFKQIFETD